MVENTLFTQIDKILKIYPRLNEYISFPFFRVPEPVLNVFAVIYLFRRKVTKPTIRCRFPVLSDLLLTTGTSWCFGEGERYSKGSGLSGRGGWRCRGFHFCTVIDCRNFPPIFFVFPKL